MNERNSVREVPPTWVMCHHHHSQSPTTAAHPSAPECWHGEQQGRRSHHGHLCYARALPGIPTSSKADEHIKKLPH